MPRLGFPVLFLSIILLSCPRITYSQVPDLVAIKAAAENGDADAQFKLGQAYWWRFNFPAAREWFQKSAEQGNAQAQWQLGELLIQGKPKMGESKEPVPKSAEAAFKWYFLAANQGFGPAQFSVGDCYSKGIGIKQDQIEAYKWYRLGRRKNELGGKLRMDPLILSLTEEQIREGEARASKFTARKVGPAELPKTSSAVPDGLALKGITGTSKNRLAIINNKTVANGEEATISIGQRALRVKCLEIKERSVVIQLSGSEQPVELFL